MNHRLGEDFERILNSLPEVPERTIPQNPDIRRENGSVTVTNHYNVVVNYGREEDNKSVYECSCGCGKGCDDVATAASKIMHGGGKMKSGTDALIVLGMLGTVGYFVYHTLQKGWMHL